MYSRILKSMALTAFAALIAIPALAQVHADLGPLHIRIANEAPPPARYEHKTHRPDHHAVWIKGYWDHQGHNWVWISGRWERPQMSHHHWVKPKYQHQRGAWVYVPGHWSHQEVVEGDEYREWKNEQREHHSHDDGR